MGGGGESVGRRGQRRGGIISGINVTPMVDVVLVLLVVLMVSSTYIVAQTLKVELPRTRTSDGTTQSPAVLTLAKDGTVRWNNEPIPEDQIAAKLKQAHAESSELSLVVSADAQVPHGRVVHFIDLARLNGIHRFAINVERRE